MKILPMSDKLFAQRRRVMAMLYEAREVLGTELPRIKVRIVSFDKPDERKTLGLCFIGKDYITLCESLVGWQDGMLREIVWHELAHAYFKARHNEKCPLMKPTRDSRGAGASREVLVRALRKLAA